MLLPCSGGLFHPLSYGEKALFTLPELLVICKKFLAVEKYRNTPQEREDSVSCLTNFLEHG